MDIVDRIFELADKKYQEQRDFAVALGIQPPRVSEWRRRKSESYMKRLPQIAAVLGTSAEYLLTGEEKKPIPMNGDGLSPVKRELLEAVDGLSDEQCRKLLGIIVEAKKLL